MQVVVLGCGRRVDVVPARSPSSLSRIRAKLNILLFQNWLLLHCLHSPVATKMYTVMPAVRRLGVLKEWQQLSVKMVSSRVSVRSWTKVRSSLGDTEG